MDGLVVEEILTILMSAILSVETARLSSQKYVTMEQITI